MNYDLDGWWSTAKNGNKVSPSQAGNPTPEQPKASELEQVFIANTKTLSAYEPGIENMIVHLPELLPALEAWRASTVLAELQALANSSNWRVRLEGRIAQLKGTPHE